MEGRKGEDLKELVEDIIVAAKDRGLAQQTDDKTFRLLRPMQTGKQKT